MSKILWALAALSLFACDGGPSGDGHSKDKDTGTPANTGGLFVHATYGGATEICTVNSPNGEELGSTEDTILGLAPGDLDFQLGDLSKKTLNWVPFHVTDGGDYLTGGGHAIIEKDQVAQAEVNLEAYDQYHCASFGCDYPYEGGGCTSPNDSEDQWIYVGDDGVLHGSESDSFGGIGALTVSLNDSSLVVTSLIESDTIMSPNFDSGTLEFSYTINNDAAQATVYVSCNLKR
ncbi:MAG: hypothetical protein QG626_641 [Patescibacteria group bacterium]|nr:hypothetical protein [Patescibacteria group bacterium]